MTKTFGPVRALSDVDLEIAPAQVTALVGDIGAKIVAAAANAGNYTCVATNAAGSVTSVAAALGVVATASPGRLVNISCRATVGTGSNILIAGFVVGGAGTSGS